MAQRELRGVSCGRSSSSGRKVKGKEKRTEGRQLVAGTGVHFLGTWGAVFTRRRMCGDERVRTGRPKDDSGAKQRPRGPGRPREEEDLEQKTRCQQGRWAVLERVLLLTKMKRQSDGGSRRAEWQRASLGNQRSVRRRRTADAGSPLRGGRGRET